MKHLRVLTIAAAFVALAIGAGAVIAALGDSETASGTITVTSESADLYICEPGNTPGPACGPDDSDGAEIVFEGDEQFFPGQNQYYDIRLKNVGSRDFVVTSLEFNIQETADPGNNCPSSALHGGIRNQNVYNSSPAWLLGKAGDPENDNGEANGYPFPVEGQYWGSSTIFIAPGDYEDVRLRLGMDLYDTENCDGNVWDVTWNFIVN